MIWRFGKAAWRLLPGGIATVVFAGLLGSGALEPLERLSYNTLFRLRGELPWDDRIVLVTIDDASIQALGRFPWSRQRYIQLLDKLSKAGPSVVAIDLIWSEPSPDDAELAQVMSQYGQVVLAQAQDSNGLPLPPVPALQAAAIATGHIFRQTDGDGITRKLHLQLRNDPSLALAAVKAHSLVQETIPLPTTSPFWINWVSQAQQIQQYSFAEVIQGNVSAQVFRNRIVIVGVTAVALDPLITPFDAAPRASGVHLHATVVNNLLQQQQLHPLVQNWSVLLLTLLLAGPGFSLLLTHWREEFQVLIWVGACLSWGIVSLLMFNAHYWLPVALPFGLFTSTTVGVVLAERLRLNAVLQQQVQELWQRYEHDLVIRTPKALNPFKLRRKPDSVQSIAQLATLAEQFGRSQSAQAAIARSLSIGLLAADWDGLVWFCNPVASEWLQVQVGDRLDLRLVPDWLSSSEWQSGLQMLKQHASIAPRELHQNDRWFEMKLEPLTYQPASADAIELNQFDGLLLLLEDITARKQIEEALERQVEELQRLSQLKDDFLSTVSHELRTPMTNIRMIIELLKMPDSDEELDYYVEILDNECTRETNLINDLLDLQRLEAGAQHYYPVKIDLSAWLPPIVQPFYERAESQRQILQVQMASQLPCLVSDQISLERILVELVNNACKYTPPEGEITIAAQWTPPHFELMVKNSGAEIPETELPRIFEKFYRVPQADRWKRGGTGLGLALVKKLVECLGGRILVKSSAGLTIFTVQLPLVYSDSGSV